MPAPSFAAILVTGAPLFAQPAARDAHLAAVADLVRMYDGAPQRRTGDGVVVAFGSVGAALRCAIALQRELDAPGLRIGLDAGEVTADDTGEFHGRPVLVAERICGSTPDDEILASEVVRLLAGEELQAELTPSGALRLPGEREMTAVARLRWQSPGDEPEPGAAPGRPITVAIADDQQLVRAGFRVILESEPDLAVIGEAGDGRAAVDLVARRRPDVILMDLRMPELDGLSAAERVLADPECRTAVVMLTTFDTSEHVYRALRIGASGFLLKDTPADRLLDAVRVAAAGDALIAPSITRRLIGEFTRAARPAPGDVPAALRELTSRELDVLGFVARGLSNAEIAEQLILGESTVKTHVARMLGKLGLRDRVQAVVLAYESGLVIPDGDAHPQG